MIAQYAKISLIGLTATLVGCQSNGLVQRVWVPATLTLAAIGDPQFAKSKEPEPAVTAVGAGIPPVPEPDKAQRPLAPPLASSPSTGDGGGVSTRIEGTVTTITPAGDASPVSGADIALSDERRATSDASGRFVIAGEVPADGVYHISAPGYIASTVVGLTDRRPDFHLRNSTAVIARPSVTATSPTGDPLEVYGRVVDETGAPKADVIVSFSDEQGSSAYPAVTDATGTYHLRIQAPGRRVINGQILAFGRVSPHFGFIGRINLGPDDDAIDTVTGGGVDPLQLRVANHRLRVNVNSPGELAVKVTAAIALPGALEVNLPVDGEGVLVPTDPSVRVSLYAEGRNDTLGIESSVTMNAPTLDANNFDTTIPIELLAPPELQTPLPLASGQPLTWTRPPQAQSSLLQIFASTGGLTWEAWTPNTTLTLSPDGVSLINRSTLKISVWDDPTLNARSVAFSKPAALRQMPLTRTNFRFAARRFAITP